MLDTLTEHLFDLLQNEMNAATNTPLLSRGGTAYAEGWLGVKRTDADEAFTAGYVNLVESSYELDSSEARPAIYRGMKGMEASDKRDMPVASALGQHLEYRAALIPLVLVVNVPGTKRQASRACHQLLANVEAILYRHLIESGFWYELILSDEAGGRRTWSSAPTPDYAEAMAILPVKLRYSWSVNAPA